MTECSSAFITWHRMAHWENDHITNYHYHIKYQDTFPDSPAFDNQYLD